MLNSARRDDRWKNDSDDRRRAHKAGATFCPSGTKLAWGLRQASLARRGAEDYKVLRADLGRRDYL